MKYLKFTENVTMGLMVKDISNQKFPNNIRSLRKLSRLTQADIARVWGVMRGDVSRIEAGKVGLTPQKRELLKAAFGWTAAQLFDQPLLVPVVGKIGAGAKIYFVDDYPKGQGDDMVPLPRDVEPNAVALRIEGESMLPLKAGWLVYYSEHCHDIDRICLNQLCVVRLITGETYLKELIRGSEKGKYHLFSYNAPLIENVDIDWCAKVEAITTK